MKTITPQELRSSVIYDVPCGGCNKHYIGQSSQWLKKRLGQHKNDIRTGRDVCALGAHALHNKHTFNFDQAKIVARAVEKSRFGRNFLEMVYIQAEDTVNFRTDISGLSSIYSNLIDLHARRNRKGRVENQARVSRYDDRTINEVYER